MKRHFRPTLNLGMSPAFAFLRAVSIEMPKILARPPRSTIASFVLALSGAESSVIVSRRHGADTSSGDMPEGYRAKLERERPSGKLTKVTLLA